MTSPDARLVDRIFAELLEYPAPEREAVLNDRCAGDEPLEAAVRRLLAAVDSHNDTVEASVASLRNQVFESLAAEHDFGEELSGSRIGSWQIVERIARGGLATVYLADRADGAYEQRAAVKVMRRGLDTDDLITRFRAERQILSTLEHPSISRILDGGALDDGRPYLVLEYVDGKPITEYAEAKQLGLRERIKLITTVLGALNHAHRHLVVHRDIKPSNILVTDDGKLALLDFGIAKLLDPTSLPGGTTRTRTGVALMTPGYASPEQRSGTAVTTATDIYQVGAVLYELLAECRPALRDAVVVPPSRSAADAKRRKQLQGDLDAIVARALREEPEERYASADEMRSDLQRYLEGRPVLAQPDTLMYRLRKFQRRRPWVLPGLTAVVLVTAGFLLTLVNYNEQARLSEQRAAAARNFMVDLLRSPDPFRPADPDLGSRITVRQALDHGVRKLEASPDEDSELRASLLASISSVYASLDQHDDAIRLRRQALASERQLFGEQSEPVMQSYAMLANQLAAVGDYQGALEAHEQQLSIAMTLYETQHPAVGVAEAAVANFHNLLGNFDASERLFESAIPKLRGAQATHTSELIRALLDESVLHLRESQPRPELALELIDEARQISDSAFGPDGLPAALVHARAAAAERFARNYDAARTEYDAAISIYEQQLGRNHGASLSVLTSYGLFFMAVQQPAESEAVLREVLQRYLEKYDEAHRLVADAYQNLATIVRQQQRYEEAVELHGKAHEIYSQLPLDTHFLPALPLLSIADARLELMRPDLADSAASEALSILEATAPESYLVGIAECLRALAADQGGGDSTALWASAHSRLVGSEVSRHYRARCQLPDATAK